MKTPHTLILIALLAIVLSACTPKPEQIAPYAQQTVDAWATSTPYPTYTALPTLTPIPTYTPQIIIQTKVVTPTSTPTPVYTATITLTPTNTATLTPTTDPLKRTKPSGFYLVNVYIAPGVWKSNGTGDKCYWEVTTATGDIINNHFGMAGGTMYIPASAFQVRMEPECGTWDWLQP